MVGSLPCEVVCSRSPAPLGPLCMGPSLAQLATQAPTRAVDGDHLREMKQAIEDQAALFTLAFLIPSACRHPWPAVAVLSRRPYQPPASVPNSAWRSRCPPLSPACRLPF